MRRINLAFTVIELLVVCAIIGILAALIFVNLDRGKLRSRDTQRKSDAYKIMGAVAMYGVDNKGTLPASDYNIELTGGTLANALVGGGYLDSLPADPLCKASSGCSSVTPTLTGYVYIRDDAPNDSCGCSNVVGVAQKGFVYASLEAATSEDLATMSSTFDSNCLINGNSLKNYTCAVGTILNFKVTN